MPSAPTTLVGAASRHMVASAAVNPAARPVSRHMVTLAAMGQGRAPSSLGAASRQMVASAAASLGAASRSITTKYDETTPRTRANTVPDDQNHGDATRIHWKHD